MCRRHAFVQGLASGNLPRERFVYYLSQAAALLESFSRAQALALARAPDVEGVLAFESLLAYGLAECKWFDEEARRWDPEADRTPGMATRSYSDFLLRVAALDCAPAILAATTPTLRLHEFLCRELEPILDPSTPYRDFVLRQAGDGHTRAAEQSEALLDRYAERGAPPAVSDRMTLNYRTAMKLEYHFFDAAWREAISIW